MNKNIKKTTIFSLPFIFKRYLSTVSFPPATQLTKGLPINLPNIKARIDPRKIPINE